MIQQKLGSRWGIWCQYEGDKASNKEVNYDRNLELLLTIESLQELAYVWKNLNLLESPIQMMANTKEGTLKKFANGKSQEFMKIEALCYFRSGVFPAWEDPQVKGTGIFNFYLQPQLNDIIPIYQSLVLYVVGDLFKNSEQVNGIRFVDKYSNGKSNCKIELWVRFKDSEKQFFDSFLTDIATFLTNNSVKDYKLEFRPVP